MLVGAFAGAVGLKGEVKLASFTASRADIASYGPLHAEDGRTFEIISLRPNSKGFAAKVKGVTTREEAEKLTRVSLYLPRASLPAAADGNYYVADLIGLEAINANSETVGEVVAVQNFGAGDLFEIKLKGEERTILLPFTKAVVPEVNLSARRVVVLPPKELLDDKPPTDGDRGDME